MCDQVLFRSIWFPYNRSAHPFFNAKSLEIVDLRDVTLGMSVATQWLKEGSCNLGNPGFLRCRLPPWPPRSPLAEFIIKVPVERG